MPGRNNKLGPPVSWPVGAARVVLVGLEGGGGVPFFSVLFSLICRGWTLLKADTLILEKALDCNGVCQPNQRKGHNKSVPNPWRPLEQLFLHAEGGLVRWKEAYVCPGATLPPWLAGENERRQGGKEAGKVEYQTSAGGGGGQALPATPGRGGGKGGPGRVN